MNLFLSGMAVGFILFAVIAAVVILNKIQQELAQLSRNTDALNKALQVIFAKVTKIEKTTITTMDGIETFIDGLRQATEVMFSRPPQEPMDGFDDLKKSFEDGIKRFENEMNPEDEDEDENKEDWQK